MSYGAEQANTREHWYRVEEGLGRIEKLLKQLITLIESGLTLLAPDAATAGTAEQLELPAAQLKHGG